MPADSQVGHSTTRGASSRAVPPPPPPPQSVHVASGSPPLRASARDPLRISGSPVAAAAGSNTTAATSTAAIGSASAPNTSFLLSAREKSAPPRGGRLLDDEFRLLDHRGSSSSDGDEDSDFDLETAAADLAAKGPFIAHSYQQQQYDAAIAAGTTDSGRVSPSPESSVPDRSPLSSGGRLVKALLLPCAILLSVGNSITWKRMLNRYASIDGSHRNLEFFVNQWTLLLYIIACSAIFAFRSCWSPGHVTPEQRKFPQSSFALMGALDAIAGLFGAVGGSLTAGQVQIVINQANIPITMLFSRIYLKVTSYTWSQYLGAAVIIAGGLVSALGTAGDEETQHAVWFGPVLIFIAVIPGAMSNVYKEENFKAFNLDLFYLSTYVSLWQALMSFACIPLFTLSYFGGVPLTEMPQNLLDGWNCFLGEYVEGYACETASPSSATLVLLFVFVNFLYNLALLSMVKHGSALFLVIACAMALPLTNIVFTQAWVMGEDVERFSIWNMVGLALVVVGFLLYSLVTDDETGEFIVPTGPSAGHSMYLTENFPSSTEIAYYVGRHEPERRYSFDFHSSPSVRRVNDARKKRLERALARATGNKTPSRTP